MRILRQMVLALSAVQATAIAYEPVDHQKMTESAYALTVLANDPGKRIRLGMAKDPLAKGADKFKNSKGDPGTIVDLLRDGAAFEDESLRPLNHFFNPVTNSALHIDVASRYPLDVLPALVALVNAGAQSSPDWALNGIENQYSYAVMKNAHWQALTSTDNKVRSDSTGRTFEILGNIVHHLQDMAQPQHVRNDMHWEDPGMKDCPPNPHPLFNPLCDAYRQLSVPSTYEAWTVGLRGAIPLSGYLPVYGPGAGVSAGPRLPREFWANGGRGIAEFTSRNFKSTGTMLVSPPVLADGEEVVASQLCAGAVPPCEVEDLDHVVAFAQNAVDDQLRPATGGQNRRAAALSIFEWDFKRIAPAAERPFTVNRFTFQEDNKFLIPRAVGYSAGFINYYFRGDMEFAVPDEGAYSVVDTAPQACGSALCGFRKVKLKLRNTTPDDDIGAGQLRVVAKFHLNTCHRSDLSGSYGGPAFTGKACRSDEEYAAVSEPVVVSGVGREFGQAFEFLFISSYIPVEASDLSLQVVFRGKLGQENDAIAVTTKDIAEPNFVAIANITDYAFDIGGDQQYHPVSSTPYNTLITLSSVVFALADPATVPPIGTLTNLEAAQHAQLAFLRDTGDFRFWLRTTSSEDYTPEVDVPSVVETFELIEGATPEESVYERNCPVVLERGMYREMFRYYSQIRHRYYGGRQTLVSAGTRGRGSDFGAMAKAGTGCYVVPSPGSGGREDLSGMTPLFTPSTASRWQINF